MDRYLLQLRSDIREAIALTPVSEAFDPDIQWDDEPPFSGENNNADLFLPTLFGIPLEAFPPGSFLTDPQMEALVNDLNQLWTAYRLSWDVPPDLSIGQQYSAMLRAMKEETVAWNIQTGGAVRICHFETNGYCPHGQQENCYCKKIHEAAEKDLAVWEEYVRSQGIDPYQELTEEAGAAFQKESKRRSLLRRSDEEWPELWNEEATKRLDTNALASQNNFQEADAQDEWFGFFISEDDEFEKND